jgi:adenosine deaminase
MLELFLITTQEQDTEVTDILVQQDDDPPHYHYMITYFLDATLLSRGRGAQMDLSGGHHGHPTSCLFIFISGTTTTTMTTLVFILCHNP